VGAPARRARGRKGRDGRSYRVGREMGKWGCCSLLLSAVPPAPPHRLGRPAPGPHSVRPGGLLPGLRNGWVQRVAGGPGRPGTARLCERSLHWRSVGRPAGRGRVGPARAPPLSLFLERGRAQCARPRSTGLGTHRPSGDSHYGRGGPFLARPRVGKRPFPTRVRSPTSEQEEGAKRRAKQTRRAFWANPLLSQAPSHPRRLASLPSPSPSSGRRREQLPRPGLHVHPPRRVRPHRRPGRVLL